MQQFTRAYCDASALVVLLFFTGYKMMKKEMYSPMQLMRKVFTSLL